MDGTKYDRYTDLFNKENELIKHRISWLFATQTLLLGGLKIPDIDCEFTFAIKIIGLCSSVFFLISITAAIITYLKFLFVHPKIDTTEKLDYPEFNRSRWVIILGFLAPFALPVVFIWAWIFLLL